MKKFEEIYYIEMDAGVIAHAIGMKAGTAEQECWCENCEGYAAILRGEEDILLNDGPNYVRIAYIRL